MDNNKCAFLQLVKAGLWEKDFQLKSYGVLDFSTILSLAEVQGVTGLISAGLEHLTDIKPNKNDLLHFVGRTMQLEQRNIAMNHFIGLIVGKMQEAGIDYVLVKGQGVAQCYERPLWRPSGDIDFLLRNTNYDKAVYLFKSLYQNSKDGGRYSKEYAFYSEQWMIELHGSLRTCLSTSVDKEVDVVQNSVFTGRNMRSWDDGGVLVSLPAPNEDVFFVYTHFIKHFYKEGMSLRQVCDWCRLLWKYRSKINVDWLKSHLRKAGLMKEWKAFAAMTVDYLGMPVEAMPFYDPRFKDKGSQLVEFILGGYSGKKIKDTWQIAKIFPWKVLIYSPSIFLNVNWLKVRERLISVKG